MKKIPLVPSEKVLKLYPPEKYYLLLTGECRPPKKGELYVWKASFEGVFVFWSSTGRSDNRDIVKAVPKPNPKFIKRIRRIPCGAS